MIRSDITTWPQRYLALAAVLLLSAFVVPATRPAAQAMAYATSQTSPIYLPHVATGPINGGRAYYVSPAGNDNHSGQSPAQPWATFNRAWQTIEPGDSLILMDGVYFQSLNPNRRNGEPGSPITIRAMNDGQAIVDGQYQRIPIKLGDTWPGPIGDYFVIEGIVARNSSGSTVYILGDHNILRRITAYNADTNSNQHVILLTQTAEHNLVEDCVASGTGRKMILIFQGQFNTVRRCLADWRQWDGRNWPDCWPWGDGIEIYNASNNTLENVINFGRNPTWGISLQANAPNATANNNRILGSMSLRAGMTPGGSVINWGNSRPQPTPYTCIRDFNWPSQRAGLVVHGPGQMSNNLFQDVFSWGSAGLGLTFVSAAGFHPGNANNQLIRATILNNGLDNPHGPWPGQFGGPNTDVLQQELGRFSSIQNSHIQNIFIDWPSYPNGARNLSSMNGEGARLLNRYVFGTMTNVPLWPWPMEGRIQAELGFSVTNTVLPIISGTQVPYGAAPADWLSLVSPVSGFSWSTIYQVSP